MNINATLLVQALNFYIFYWIVRLFLCKPLIQYIQAAQDEKDALDAAISQRQEIITQMYNERQLVWKECRNYCLTARPYLQDTFYYTQEKVYDHKNHILLANEYIQNVTHTAREYLIKRIGQ